MAAQRFRPPGTALRTASIAPTRSWSTWGRMTTLVRTLQCRRMAKLPELNDTEDLVALNATVDGRLVAVSVSGSQRGKLPGLRVRVHLHDVHGWRSVELAAAEKARSARSPPCPCG